MSSVPPGTSGKTVVAVLVIASLFAASSARPAAGPLDMVIVQLTGNPFLVTGNPSCAALNASADPRLVGLTSDYGFKIDPPRPGSYTGTLTSAFPLPVFLTGGAIADSFNTATVTVNDTNQYFDFATTLGIDAVIVKASSGSLVYVLDSTGGVGLHGPINSSDDVAEISHIEFCYDYEVTVAKTANTTFTRTYTWGIDKTVTPDTLHLFTGDSATVDYNVAVTKTATDSDWAVSGAITITNNTPLSATVTSIADSMGPDVNVTLNGCSGGVMAPGATMTCNYHAPLDDGTSRVNTATVATSGVVGGNQATAAVAFGEPTNEVGPKTVTVNDSNGSSWSFDDSGSQAYSRTLSCDGNQGLINNTVTIDSTGPSDSAAVRVNCYRLGVEKTAATSFQRNYSWTIAKSAGAPSATLEVGQSMVENYSVTLNAAFSDSAHLVTGAITITNPAPMAAVITNVSDVLIGVGAIPVDCGVAFPYSLAAGGSLMCSYTANVADKTPRTNTATATIRNTNGGSTGFEGSANVAFGTTPSTEVDRCVSVSDAFNGGAAAALGAACYGGTQTFAYTQPIGPFDSCGAKTVVNTASFLGASGATGSSSATVSVNVPCAPVYAGCTRTIGYWKTHDGPLRERLGTGIWLGTGAGKSLLVTTVRQAIDIFASGDSSNGVNKLRAQLLAAKLNLVAGADSVTIAATIAAADALLATIAPADWKNLSGAMKQQIDALKTTLDTYNNGLLGPSHCI